MSTCRRKAVNENISTFDSAGGKDYTTLAAWEAATDNDLVTAAQSEVLECYKGAHLAAVTINGATVDASYFRIIRPAVGEGHIGIPKSDGSCVEFHATADITQINIDENYFLLQDIVLKHNPNTASIRNVIYILNQLNVTIAGCLIYDSNSTGGGTVRGILPASGSNFPLYIINCLIHNIDGDGIYVTSGTHLYLYNCTLDSIAGADMYTRDAGSDIFAKNVIYKDYTVNAGSINLTTCLDVDVAAPIYVDSANDDFHLDPIDTNAKDQGTDLSADGDFAFNDDINQRTMGGAVSGQIRVGSWDIGFDELKRRINIA